MGFLTVFRACSLLLFFSVFRLWSADRVGYKESDAYKICSGIFSTLSWSPSFIFGQQQAHFFANRKSLHHNIWQQSIRCLPDAAASVCSPMEKMTAFPSRGREMFAFLMEADLHF